MPFDPADLDRLIADDLADRDARHLLRSRRAVTHLSATHVRLDADPGRTRVNFASNNYLGLTHHPAVIDAVRRATGEWGAGSSAAPLITGYTSQHAAAERAIADWKGTGDAVLLASGYQANLAVVQTLAALAARRGGVRFLIDKLAHASLVDAVRGSGAAFRVFPHNGLAKVRRLLADAPAEQLQVVLTESIFSMDGDAADLAGLVAIKRERPFLLVLDEAHGSGVYGMHGAGYAAEVGLSGEVDVSVVTLSKALGGVGGAVCGSRNFCAAVVNHGRAFVYSTALPPAVAAGAAAAIGVMRDEPARQGRVRELAVRVRAAVARLGYEAPRGDSPIVPVVVGSEERAIRLSRGLVDAGMLVPAVRPPTVAKGSSRLRVTLCCDHTDAEVGRLIEALGSEGAV